MTNLSAAKSALKAELHHVQAGLAFYQERVEALSEALSQLDALEDVGEVEFEQSEKKTRGRPKKAVTAKRGRPVARSAKAGAKTRGAAKAGKAANTESAASAKKRGRAAAGDSRLPSTGGDFFPGLLSERRQSAPELLHAAVAQLPFEPTTAERNQLRARMIAALSGLLKSGRIASEGSGRQRTYFWA